MFIMMHLFGHESQEWLIQQDESEQCKWYYAGRVDVSALALSGCAAAEWVSIGAAVGRSDMVEFVVGCGVRLDEE